MPRPELAFNEHGIATSSYLCEIVSALGPRLRSLRNRATMSSARKARTAKAKKTGSDVLNTIIADETKTGLKPRTILQRVNARWKVLGKEPITYDALRGASEKTEKTGCLIDGRTILGRLLDDR
jgi:hypothetical protein